mgnify:CR=1 FL=1
MSSVDFVLAIICCFMVIAILAVLSDDPPSGPKGLIA